MPRTYSPPKTRANPKAVLTRAQRRKKRGSARLPRSTRRSRSVSRSKKQHVTPAPLIKGNRLTGTGRKAAARGEEEYQELVCRFDGRVHLSRGRPAAVNARLKLISGPSRSRPTGSSQSKPRAVSAPRARRRRAAGPSDSPPAPDDTDLQVSFLSESESEDDGAVQEDDKGSIVTVPPARAPENLKPREQNSGQSESNALAHLRTYALARSRAHALLW